jgi:hypothetical protein
LAALVVAAATCGATDATAAPVYQGWIPNPAVACSPGQPKLDYEYQYTTDNINYYDMWSNVCGVGMWRWGHTGYVSGAWADFSLIAIRMPTFPAFRVWLHDGTNLQDPECLYSRDSDRYVNANPEVDFTEPFDLQVSGNTAPC